MKKIISIGIALALLTMAVVPGAVAAYTPPDSYAKVPFAIVQSGFELLEGMWPDLDAALGIGMDWLGPVLGDVGEWAGGPLSWTVDMLAWGIGLAGDVVEGLDGIIAVVAPDADLPLADIASLFDTVACGLLTCFTEGCYGTFDPCTP